MTGNRLISIVDDDASARAAVAGLVRALGFAAVEFPGAAEFLGSDHVGRTACLVADVRMPGMTGLGLYHHLVASGTAIPTVLMTAYPEETTRVSALKAGVGCYLGKPLDSDKLLDCIMAALREPNTLTITTKELKP